MSLAAPLARSLASSLARGLGAGFDDISPSAVWDFIGGVYLGAGPLTLTRASDGGYTDANGDYADADVDVLRFDHDPETLAPLGGLIESPGTNLFVESLPVDTDDGWEKGPNTTRVGADVAFGSGNATAYQSNGSASNDFVSQQIAVTSGVTYTVSVYARIVSGTKPTGGNLISAQTTPGSPDIRQNRSFATSTLDGTLRRYSVTFTAEGTGFVSIFFVTSQNNTATIALAGAQAEAGSSPSSYIPTTSAAATRAVDVLTAPIGDWFNPSEGTWIVESSRSYAESGSAFPRVLQIDDGSSGNSISLLWATSTSRLYATVSSGGVVQASIGPTGLTQTAVNKIAAAYKVNNFAASVNGIVPGVDTFGTVPTGLTTVRFGNQPSNTAPLFGHIRRVSYIPRRVSNAELQALSA